MNYTCNDAVSRVAFMESLDTPDKLLEYSLDIYSSDSDLKRSALENVVRYGDLSMEQLSDQNQKLHATMRSAIENNIPLTESHQNFLVGMSKLVKTRMTQVLDPVYQNRRLMVDVLENDLGYVEDVEYVSESMNPYGDAMMHNLHQIESATCLTSRGLYEACDILCSPYTSLDDAMRDSMKSAIQDKLKTTLQVELSEPDRYIDIPILQALNNTRGALKDAYADKDEVCQMIDKMMDELEDSLEELVKGYADDYFMENGFNPDPFNFYNLTPLPVGTRTLTRAMTDLINAETDEAVDEAVMNLGRIIEACGGCDEEDDDDDEDEDGVLEAGDGPVAKATRKIARGSKKLASKYNAQRKKSGEVKNNLDKAAEPWARIIQDYDKKIRTADKEERRTMIIKGGAVPKLSRALKRGILALVAGSVVGGPFLGAITTCITMLATIAIDKRADARTKNQILQELEDELEIVNEKIDDSRGDEDKSKKYELMRIRAKLQKEIDRINLGLKY